MAANLFNKYIWLAETIYSAGRITRREIDSRWARASINDLEQSRIPETTFHRWKQEAEELFGLIIDCHKPTNTYFIANSDDITANRLQQWLLNSFSVSALVRDSQNIKNSILLEDMPSDARYLTPLIEALKQRRVMHVSYRRFDAAEPYDFFMKVYCLKAFKQRWYMVGESSMHNGEVRVYALDRILDLSPVEQYYTIPEDFDGQTFFSDYYGVWLGDMKAEKVVIRTTFRSAQYLRSLPLHHSQKELKPLDGETHQFGFQYYIAPTFDFIQELRTHGSDLKITEPQWLADRFVTLAKEMLSVYNND